MCCCADSGYHQQRESSRPFSCRMRAFQSAQIMNTQCHEHASVPELFKLSPRSGCGETASHSLGESQFKCHHVASWQPCTAPVSPTSASLSTTIRREAHASPRMPQLEVSVWELLLSWRSWGDTLRRGTTQRQFPYLGCGSFLSGTRTCGLEIKLRNQKACTHCACVCACVCSPVHID